jgi:hypothetical protein
MAGLPHATTGAPLSGEGSTRRGSEPSSWTGSWLSTWAHGSIAAALGVGAVTLTTAVELELGVSLWPPGDSAKATMTTTGIVSAVAIRAARRLRSWMTNTLV